MENKHINFPKEEYTYKFNEIIKIPKWITKHIPIEDEWDTEAICKKIMDVTEPVIIKAKFAESGKSYIDEYFLN